MTAKRGVAVLFVVALLFPTLFMVGKGIQIGVGIAFSRYTTGTGELIDILKRSVTGEGNGSGKEIDFRLIADKNRMEGWKYFLIDYYGLTQKMMGKNYLADVDPTRDVFRMKNGALTFVDRRKDAGPMPERAEEIVRLHRYLTEEGIPFLHIQTPFKVDPLNPELPAGVWDYTNEKIDAFLTILSENGAPCFDLRGEIRREFPDYSACFFVTDHHWTPETGLWAAGRVAEELDRRFGFPYSRDTLDPENYQTTVYPDLFLGTYGKRTGRYYVTPDDFSLLTPRFKTSLEVEYLYPHAEKITGDFEEVFFQKESLLRFPHKMNPYMTYSHGDSMAKIHHPDAPVAKKVIIIRDSFASVVTPFLALCCRDLVVVDCRAGNLGKDFNLRRMIEEERPDLVVTFLNVDFALNDRWNVTVFDSIP